MATGQRTEKRDNARIVLEFFGCFWKTSHTTYTTQHSRVALLVIVEPHRSPIFPSFCLVRY